MDASDGRISFRGFLQGFCGPHSETGGDCALSFSTGNEAKRDWEEVQMTLNVIDQPAKADEDRLNMKAYADALTEFIAIIV